jgi:prevent-host-death family protein
MVNNFSDIAESLSGNQPVFITKNGKGAYAIMSMEAYDLLAEQHSKLSANELAEIYQKIDEAEKDFQSGHTLSLDEFKSIVRRDYDKI